MQSFYSILLVPLRPEIHEQVSVGLLLRNERRIYFQFSNQKLKWLKAQLSAESFRLLSHSLKAIEKVLNTDFEHQKESMYLFPNETPIDHSWDRNYISYLSQYNHNLLIFTPPQSISLDANTESFEKLFHLFVSETTEEPRSRRRILPIDQYLKENFYPKIENRVNQNFELSSQVIPTLIAPTTVDFIGQNERPVIGQKIQFSKRYDFVSKDIGEIIALNTAFERLNTQNGKYYIIGEEPSKVAFPKSHDIWKNIRKYEGLDYVDYRETDAISEYLENHNVHPFFET